MTNLEGMRLWNIFRYWVIIFLAEMTTTRKNLSANNRYAADAKILGPPTYEQEYKKTVLQISVLFSIFLYSSYLSFIL